MQEGHDANVPIREAAPIDKMPFVAEKITFNAKVGGNRLGMGLVGIDAVESLEQPVDVAVGLFRTPAITRVAVDLVESPGRRFLKPYLGHAVSPGCARSPRRQIGGGKSSPGRRRHGPARPSAGQKPPALFALCHGGSGRACIR